MALVDTPQSDILFQFLEGLAQSGRVFQFDGKPYMLDPSLGAVHALGKAEEAAHTLVHGQLLHLVNREGAPVPLSPNAYAAGSAILACCRVRQPWPTIESLVHGPVWDIAGERLVRAPEGISPARRRIVLAPREPMLPEPNPTYPHLKRVFSGLEFADPVYKANLLGLVIALFARTGLDSFPIVLIDARQKSSGKTSVASALAYIVMGRDVPPETFKPSENDFEVSLGNQAGRPGPTLIYIDNIRPKRGQVANIRSQLMSAAVHQHAVRVRQLYSGQTPLFDPIFLLTMNGAKVEGDLGDKAVAMSLRRPPSADNHRILEPFPPHYAKEHRLALLAEVGHILDNMVLPPISTNHLFTRFYRFEQIVVTGAAALGLKASLDPALVHTVDACVDELFNLLLDEMPAQFAAGAVPINQLVEVLEASPGVRELNEILSAASRTRKGKQRAFIQYIQNNMHGHQYRWEAAVYSLEVQDTLLRITRS